MTTHRRTARAAGALLAAAAAAASASGGPAVRLDLLGPFLEEVCAPGVPTLERWLRHEDRHWTDYRSLIYETDELASLRERSWQLIEADAAAICPRASRFRSSLPGLADAAADQVESLTGLRPAPDVSLVAPLLLTDARAIVRDGALTLVFNGTHPSVDDAPAFSLLLLHEFLHAAHDAMQPGAAGEVQAGFDGRLYREGFAMYGGALLTPGSPLTLLDGRLAEPDQEASRLVAAVEYLRASLPAGSLDRLTPEFFDGGASSTWPDRYGYYLGLRVFECLAREQGRQEALTVAADEFAAFWQAVLRDPARCFQAAAPVVTSLLGRPLAPPGLEPETEARMEVQLAEARAAWEKDRDGADALIWVGRRTAYLGRYREAIEIFSDGIARHPTDARMYRHRGHRYLTVREIGKAIADFEKAAALIAGRPDEVEPDGLPNARNIPTGTLHSNVYYHLALGYYLQGDFGRAADTWARARDAVDNADNLVAASHWLYLSLRRAGRPDEAAAVLPPVTADLDVIENGEYHQLLLMYKGERTPEAILAAAGDDSGGSAARYGVSAWHLINGRRSEAESLWVSILEGSDWAAFGYLAAEAEVASAQPQRISYERIAFEPPQGRWQRSRGAQDELHFERMVEPQRHQVLSVLKVDFPHEMRLGMPRQHASRYFASMRSFQLANTPAGRQQELVEQTLNISGHDYAAMRFRLSARDPQDKRFMEGLYVLVFPPDFAQRREYYLFIWRDFHPAEEPRQDREAGDIAPFLDVLRTVTPKPLPLIDAILYRLVDDLPAEPEAATPVAAGDARARAARSAQATRSAAHSYSSLTRLSSAGRDTRTMQWRADFAAPDKSHVLLDVQQVVNGSEEYGTDEWIVDDGKQYSGILGFDWREEPLESAAGRTSRFLAVDKFLRLLDSAEPVSAVDTGPPAARHLLLHYDGRLGPELLADLDWSSPTQAEPVPVRIWIDAQTLLLARADVTVTDSNGNRIDLRQGFSGYGQPILIESPVR